jgi:uncharacterized YccA/Bax inhibitor family protein
MQSADQLNQWYAQPAFGAQTQQGPGYGVPAAPSRYLTLDDVITRSVLLIGTLFTVAAFTWFGVPKDLLPLALIVGGLGGFGLGLYMSFSGKANAVTCTVYAGLQGLAMGGISRIFDDMFPGIAVQAITGTIMVAGGVLVVYKTGAVRVTPKFTRIVFAAMLGAAGLMLVNLIASIFTPGGLGLRDASSPALAIGFSLLCIVIAAAMLIIDFDSIEQNVRRGVDEQFGWYLSFGLLVTLVWLYIEILQLLSYFRE